MASADPIKLVKDFLASLRPGANSKPAPRAELLTEDAVFQTLGKVEGRDAVIERMAGESSGQPYRVMQWSEPETDGGEVRITGRMPAGSAMGGVVITFRFAGERICAVLQQPLPGAPVPATPLRLTPELKALVDGASVDGFPLVVAYVDEGGQPILSFRGSTQAFSDTQLAIWVRNSDGHLLDSLAKNPRVALMYRSTKTRALYQFQGRAQVSTDAAARERIYEKMSRMERNHDYAHKGTALVIDLDRVEGWAGVGPDGQIGKVRMLREPAK